MDDVGDAGYFWAVVDESSAPPSIRARGELDAGSAPDLLVAVDSVVQAGAEVVLDLLEVTFIDSSGIRAIAETLRRSELEGFAFRVSDASEAVTRLLEMTGMTSLLG